MRWVNNVKIGGEIFENDRVYKRMYFTKIEQNVFILMY